jgi:alcohol dehydrogenase class IV
LNAGAVTDALARDAFCKAFTSLPVSFAGDTSVRLEMHLASTMAGMAFSQAGLGLCHAMSHVLGGKFHVPHGRLNAILLPAVVEVNAPAAVEKYAEVARAAGLGGAAELVALRNLKNGLVRLRKELRLPATLAQAGIEPQKVQSAQARIAEAVLADPCCKTNPVPVTKDLVLRVLETVTGHG